MTATFLELVVMIKDRIALSGSTGCKLSDFLNVSLGDRTIAISPHQLCFILNRFLIPDGFFVLSSSSSLQNMTSIDMSPENILSLVLVFATFIA